MRLVQVRDLVEGQAWFDLVQHRYLPPGGVLMHWSRWLDAPLALSVMALTPFVGQSTAFGIVSAAWPLLMLIAMMTVLFVGMRRTFGPRAALLGVFAVALMSPVLAVCAPGRIDHHNVQMLCVLTLAFCVADIESRRAPAVGGMAAALSLAIGLEALPYIALAAGFYAWHWVHRGRPAHRPLLVFSLSLAGCALVLFMGQTAPPRWAVSQCDALSPPWLWLAASGLAVSAALAVLPGSLGFWRRSIAVVIAGAMVAGSFAVLFQECLDGPWGTVPVAMRDDWIAAIPESFSAARLASALPMAVVLSWFVPIGVAAAIFLACAIRARHGRDRRSSLLFFGFSMIGLVISLAYMRGIFIVFIFVAAAFGVAIEALAADWLRTGRLRAWQIGDALAGLATLPIVVLALGALASLAGPATADPDAAEREVKEFKSCYERARYEAIDKLPVGRVLSPFGVSAYLFLHTRHGVLTGGYHRAPDGIAAGIWGFDSVDAIHTYARLLDADYVVMCRFMKKPGDETRLELPEKLYDGSLSPAWMERIPIEAGPLAVWRVKPLPTTAP